MGKASERSAKLHDLELDIFVNNPLGLAIMVENLNGEKVWLPRNQIEIDGKTVTLPEWLALDKGLI